jgi:hypothetical protein
MENITASISSQWLYEHIFIAMSSHCMTADKQLRARRRAEQIRASRAKKMPDRKGPKQS